MVLCVPIMMMRYEAGYGYSGTCHGDYWSDPLGLCQETGGKAKVYRWM